MKEIKAIVKPFMLEAVLTALDAMPDLPGVTVSEVLGWGRLPGRKQEHDTVEAGHGFTKKVKLEIVVSEQQESRVVNAIVAAARTGNPGDGKVFVLGVTHAVRIRTGEQDHDAI